MMFDENNHQYSSEENLFEKMENVQNTPPVRKFQRSKSNVILTGVCAGIAEYFNADAANVRVVALLTLLFGGWGAAAYFIAAVLLPVEKIPKELSSEKKKSQKKENFRTVLGGLLILTGIHFAFVYLGFRSTERLFIFPNEFVFSIIALALGILIATNYFNFSSEDASSFEINLFRSRNDRRLLGVCGGLSRYLDIDSSALRIIFLIAAMLTFGLFALVYLTLGIFINAEPEQKFE
ncbi:MAG: hypothetical protein CVV24_01310 [Ignavibacteriae bacterium HGW-Ignavibacteriae-3]|nr:MAG: hypothetical protein CVV24_01310 [Ignavibacteriae bacterium HGW-Ignavibacteriae-3]